MRWQCETRNATCGACIWLRGTTQQPFAMLAHRYRLLAMARLHLQRIEVLLFLPSTHTLASCQVGEVLVGKEPTSGCQGCLCACIAL